MRQHIIILQNHFTILQYHSQLLQQHNELLQCLDSKYDQITKFHEDFFRWAGYRPDVQPLPPYQPPDGLDG